MQTDLLSDGEINAAMTAHRVPGASITVMDANHVVWSRQWGARSVNARAPVDAGTQFPTCSMTKTVNGLLFAQLHRDGLIDLDAPVNPRLKGWQLKGPGADRVTSAMLLAHTGGTSVFGFWGYTPGAPVPSLIEILDGLAPANNRPVLMERPSGTEISYSSGGTTILQKLVEDVTGASYADIVRQRILAPLSMMQSAMQMCPGPGDGNVAHGHRDGVVVRGGWCVQPELASTGLWSTGADYARFLATVNDAVNGRSDAVLSRDLALRMITPPFGDAALGCFSQRPGIFNHAGGGVGFRTHYVADANTGRAVITLSNGEEGAVPLQALRHTICNRLGWDLPGDPPA
jgi:CubicO group peptidase (beta-lactamase class C family)